MAIEGENGAGKLGHVVSAAIMAAAVVTGLLVVRDATLSPRTDDAEVFANFIGIAPLVNGPITRLNVADPVTTQGE